MSDQICGNHVTWTWQMDLKVFYKDSRRFSSCSVWTPAQLFTCSPPCSTHRPVSDTFSTFTHVSSHLQKLEPSKQLRCFISLTTRSWVWSLTLLLVSSSVVFQLHCCGLFSYRDWNQNIPNSCLCDQEEEEEEGTCQNINYRVSLNTLLRPAAWF